MTKKITTFEVPEALIHKKSKVRSGVSSGKIRNRHTLKKPTLDWCKETCKKHWFLSKDPFTFSKLRISFYDESEAMLFKLTWL